MGSVATVIFYSDQSTQSTGFILTFEGVGIAQENSLSSKDHILEPELQNSHRVAHPGGSSYYRDKELSTFLFAPQEYNLRNFEVTYTKRGLETGCYDVIHTFKFETTTGWVPADR